MTPFLTDGEVGLIVEALGPGRLVDRARELDANAQAVLGARAAWREARDLVRGIIESAAKRSGAPADEVSETVALFDLEGGLQAVSPTDLPYWRSLATLCAPQGPWPVVSHVWMPFESVTPRSVIRSACLVALTQTLEDFPALNRAYLDGAIWQRHSPELLVPVRFGPDDLGAVVVDARGAGVADAWGLVREARTELLRARKHPLAPAFERLLAQWVWAGFISSPAGALLSDIGGSRIYHSPTPAFVGANGIPVSIVVGDNADPHMAVTDSFAPGCWVGIGVDHRVIDPAEATPLHVCFSELAPALMR